LALSHSREANETWCLFVPLSLSRGSPPDFPCPKTKSELDFCVAAAEWFARDDVSIYFWHKMLAASRAKHNGQKKRADNKSKTKPKSQKMRKTKQKATKKAAKHAKNNIQVRKIRNQKNEPHTNNYLMEMV